MSASFRTAIRPPTKLTPWEWAANNVRIANSERSPKFDPDQLPWWKAPLECAADYQTRQVVILAPTGSGKSTLGEALIPYVVSENPGPFLYASQTDPDAKFWGETRLIPALQSCESIKPLWPKDRHKSRKLEIIFPHMPLIMGGANLSNFQEKSVRWLFGDEVWAWAPGLVREFQARHHNRWNRKEYLVSQGGTAGTEDENGNCEGGDELWREWKKSDQAEFSWRCPKCREPQPYDFESLRYDLIEKPTGGIDDQATSTTARMTCRKCSKAFPDTVANRRLLASSNMKNGALGYISTAGGLHGRRGFHIDSLAIWWIPWAQEVQEFLEAKRLAKAGVVDRLRQFTQKRRARFWTDDMAIAKVEIRTTTDFTKLDHENGAPIPGEVRRFATIDAGGDHYWLTIAAWRQGGTCRVLWEGYVPSDGADEAELKALVDRYHVPPPQTFIDIGYEQDRILDLCVKHGWTGIKGEGNKRFFIHPNAKGKPIEKLFSKVKRARAKSGGIARFIFLASNPVKDVLARLLSSGTAIELPADLSKAFQNHINCERRTVERHPKTGEEKSVWIRPGSKANHLWDTMCYQVGAALAFRVFDSEEEN